MSIGMRALGVVLAMRPRPLETSGSIAARAARGRADARVPAAVRRTHVAVRRTVGGMPVVELVPRRGEAVGELLYLHGGAYVLPLVRAHWRIVARLVRDAPLRVTVPLWCGAGRTADEAFPALHRVYDGVAASGLPFALAGDSSGGAVATALALRARDERRRAPGSVVLFSPWTDARLTHPAIAAVEPLDPMLRSAGLRWCAGRWAGRRPLDDPAISPVEADLHDLPRIEVFHGGRDLLLPDARCFVDRAVAAGTEARLHVFPDAFHVFVGAPWPPESRAALDRAAAVVARAAGATPGGRPRS